jgi:transposase
MITLPAGVRVLLATRPVDFRRGAHSLAALAAEELGENPFSGVVLVFRAKRCDKVKIVHWDATGLVLVWKQLEGGRFCWPPITDGTVRLSALQFAALFSGLDYLRLPSERRIPPPTAAALTVCRCARSAIQRETCLMIPRCCARCCWRLGPSATVSRQSATA